MLVRLRLADVNKSEALLSVGKTPVKFDCKGGCVDGTTSRAP